MSHEDASKSWKGYGVMSAMTLWLCNNNTHMLPSLVIGHYWLGSYMKLLSFSFFKEPKKLLNL